MIQKKTLRTSSTDWVLPEFSKKKSLNLRVKDYLVVLDQAGRTWLDLIVGFYVIKNFFKKYFILF